MIYFIIYLYLIGGFYTLLHFLELGGKLKKLAVFIFWPFIVTCIVGFAAVRVVGKKVTGPIC